MKVQFKFLAGDVNWSQYGGAWISQKFNNSGIDYWLIREIVNWEEQNEPQPSGKYTVMLATIRPADYSPDARNQALRWVFDDDANWDDYSEEQQVEALYQWGHYIRQKEWMGNNYSLLFKECQDFANNYVEGDELSPPVDFSKLPENLLVTITKNRFGHLEGRLKSDRHLHRIAATNLHGQTTLYIQEDYNVEQFILEYIPSSKRRTLEGNWNVHIRLPLSCYLHYLGEPSDDYIEYLGTQKRAESNLKVLPLPGLFALIEGTAIYHVHKDAYGIGRESDFWYSTVQFPESLHEEYRFRVDELDPECRVESIGDEPPIDSWNRFQEHCKRAIAQALREGKLKLAPAPDAAVLGGISSAIESDTPCQAVVLGTASQCCHPDHIQFCQDMAKVGIPVEIKSTRMLWRGPVASCEDISQVMNKTQVPCIWDESGKHGFDVYPKVYAEESLINAIAQFDNPDFKEQIAMMLKLQHPLKAIAQNLIDQLAPYFPEGIRQG